MELVVSVSWCVESSLSPQLWLSTVHARVWPASRLELEGNEGQSSASLRRRSFLAEDHMYILDPRGTAAEDLSMNSVTLVARSKAGLGGCICSTRITQGVVGWGGRYYIRQLGLLVVRGRRGYIIISADHQGVAELQEVTNPTFVSDFWLIFLVVLLLGTSSEHLDNPCKHVPWPLSEFAL